MLRSFGTVSTRAWLMAVRPKTLPASVAPIFLGSALALNDGHFTGWIFFLSLVCALLLQIAVNLANDYFDFANGHDNEERLGPIRVSQQGLVPQRTMLTALVVTCLLALISGLGLVWAGGWPILLLGIFSLLGVIAYSGGPYPLASHGLGDVAVFIFFGLVAVGGSYYLHAGSVTLPVLIMASAVGALNTAILVINNLRDRHSDAKTGKNTLAVRLGRHGTLVEYKILLVTSFVLPLALWSIGLMPLTVVVAALLCVPESLRLVRRVARLDGVVLNHYLAKTAQLTLWYCLLLSAGLIITV